jgi:hypothetical protein
METDGDQVLAGLCGYSGNNNATVVPFTGGFREVAVNCSPLNRRLAILLWHEATQSKAACTS